LASEVALENVKRSGKIIALLQRGDPRLVV